MPIKTETGSVDLIPAELDVGEATRTTVNGLLDFLGHHDSRTAQHSVRMAGYLWDVFQDQQTKPRELIILGALCHDLGKISVSSDDLHPEDTDHVFSDQHRNKLRAHPAIGAMILYEYELPKIGDIAGSHHNTDGNGYGLRPSTDGEVRKSSAVVAIADWIDAIVHRSDGRFAPHQRKDPGFIQRRLEARFNLAEHNLDIVWMINLALIRKEEDRVIVLDEDHVQPAAAF